MKILVPRYIVICCILYLAPFVYSQEKSDTEKQDPPDLKSNRADEDYSYLRDPETNPYRAGFADAIKFISLNSKRTAYLSIGGQFRPRYEYTNNVNYSTNSEIYYSQRLNVHTNIVMGKYIRVFGEIFHGYTSDRQRTLETDDIDIHQAFIEFKIQTHKDNSLSFRFGRQELTLGASRLVGNREGPNMRRSFDLGKICYQINQVSLTVFYGKEVDPQFEAFDNAISLFDTDATNPEIWAVGAQFPIKNLNGTNELYYQGFRSKAAGFSDVFGEEIRHSLGVRRFGYLGKRISYNTEIIYQFGDLENNTISALNIETDWKYKLINTKWCPTIGLKFDWSTGDKETGDEKLQTFNPMFVNPAIYSLAAVNTPANLNSFHPNITIFPVKHLSIYMDYAVFYRTTKEDGLYTPPRFQIRTADGISEKHIGDAFGIQVNYQFNRNIAFDLRTSYFIPGKFIEATGDSESIFYIAPTLNFKF
ncbi:MAG: alginate export family protein [Bacteroidota bacterium]